VTEGIRHLECDIFRLSQQTVSDTLFLSSTLCHIPLFYLLTTLASSPKSPLLLFVGLPSDITHFLEYGADRVLLKPLDINAFGNAIRDMDDDDMSM
jgi:hypothetical protein